VANGASAPLRILEYVEAPDNVYTATNAQVVVQINNHQLAPATGTAGV